MEEIKISTVQAAVCIKALQLAARAERRAGDVEMAEAFTAMRREMWEKYRGAFRSPLSFDEVEAAGVDGTGRFEED